MKVKEFFRKHIFIIFAVYTLIVAAVFVFLNPYIIEKQMNLVEVPVAKVDITETTKITSDMVTTIQVTDGFLPSTVIENTENIVGQYVQNDTKIPAGSFFYSSELTSEENVLGKTARELKEGEVEYTFKLTDEDIATGTFKVNQTVSIYSIFEYVDTDGFKETAFGQLVDNARIINAALDSNGRANYITVAVSEADLNYIHIGVDKGTLCVHLPYQGESQANKYFDIDSFREFIDEYATTFVTVKYDDKTETEEVTQEEIAAAANPVGVTAPVEATNGEAQ